MRIFFIHGFGEKPTVFNQIAPHIPGSHIFIDVWEVLGNTYHKDINVLKFAKHLIELHGIQPGDVIIGHSMGGRIAFHIKHVVGCRCIQIASWTKSDRVVLPIQNFKIVYFLISIGLVFNRFSQWFMVKKFYSHKPSKEIFADTFNRLRISSKNAVISQMRIVLEPVEEAITVKPDLRIHAKADNIIRYPKGEECVTVSGDHFTLVTSPEEVYKPIISFLTKS